MIKNFLNNVRKPKSTIFVIENYDKGVIIWKVLNILFVRNLERDSRKIKIKKNIP